MCPPLYLITASYSLVILFIKLINVSFEISDPFSYRMLHKSPYTFLTCLSNSFHKGSIGFKRNLFFEYYQLDCHLNSPTLPLCFIKGTKLCLDVCSPTDLRTNTDLLESKTSNLDSSFHKTLFQPSIG